MDEGQIEVRVDKLNLPITGRFGLRLKNIADGKDDKALFRTIRREVLHERAICQTEMFRRQKSGFASSNVSRSYTDARYVASGGLPLSPTSVS